MGEDTEQVFRRIPNFDTIIVTTKPSGTKCNLSDVSVTNGSEASFYGLLLGLLGGGEGML